MRANALADITRAGYLRYGQFISYVVPNTMGFHQRPTDGRSLSGFSFSRSFLSALLRSANGEEFMVGYEMLAMPQRDIRRKPAARWLRDFCRGSTISIVWVAPAI